VHILGDEIRIFEAGRLIAAHPVLDGRHQRRVAPGHRSDIRHDRYCPRPNNAPSFAKTCLASARWPSLAAPIAMRIAHQCHRYPHRSACRQFSTSNAASFNQTPTRSRTAPHPLISSRDLVVVNRNLFLGGSFRYPATHFNGFRVLQYSKHLDVVATQFLSPAIRTSGRSPIPRFVNPPKAGQDPLLLIPDISSATDKGASEP
jgi:hypothetical protein